MEGERRQLTITFAKIVSRWVDDGVNMNREAAPADAQLRHPIGFHTVELMQFLSQQAVQVLQIALTLIFTYTNDV